MNDTKSILLAGVGGQGILLVSKVLSDILVKNGYDVKMSEVHGMAQRGGSVSTQIRYGTKVYAPFLGAGGADVLAGFEKMETYRFLPYVKPGGKVVYTDTMIPSAPVFSGRSVYPEGLDEEIARGRDVLVIPVSEWLQEIEPVFQNTIVLGILTNHLGFGYNEVEDCLLRLIKPAFHEKNKRALKKGYGFVNV
jgi:indolepyruvate ferredoxin oxidoreductase beta subunit